MINKRGLWGPMGNYRVEFDCWNFSIFFIVASKNILLPLGALWNWSSLCHHAKRVRRLALVDPASAIW